MQRGESRLTKNMGVALNQQESSDNGLNSHAICLEKKQVSKNNKKNTGHRLIY